MGFCAHMCACVQAGTDAYENRAVFPSVSVLFVYIYLYTHAYIVVFSMSCSTCHVFAECVMKSQLDVSLSSVHIYIFFYVDVERLNYVTALS